MQPLHRCAAEMVARRHLDRHFDARPSDWAVAMLEKGIDTPSLRVLAGETPPFNYFEITTLLDDAIREMGVRQPTSGEQAALLLASILAQQILDGTADTGPALLELGDLYVQLDFLPALHDFWLLRYAREDLRHSEIQYYWPGVTRETFDSTLLDCCRQYLTNHPAPA